ncbi:hypothetical protein AAG570_004935 [Ranatra chinensis]|uniref:SP-RING-type domain-containing protein n=1 Tax=Ranatra chinensis TaxID=642074 RepID=A0ABD0XYZ7_9HEMI
MHPLVAVWNSHYKERVMTQEVDDVEKAFKDGLDMYKTTVKLIADNVKDNKLILKELTKSLHEFVDMKIEADLVDCAKELLKEEMEKCRDRENFCVSEEFEKALNEYRKEGAFNTEPYDGLRDNFKKYIKKMTKSCEVESAEVQGIRRDPWTQQLIERPVVNKVCGHIYDQTSVDQFVARKTNVK